MNTTFLTAAAVALAVSTAALSQDAPAAAPKPDDAAAARQTTRPPVKVMGKLVKVEGNDLVVASSRPGAPNEVRVTLDENDTAVMFDGAPAALADLKPGTFVDISELPGRRAPGQARFRVMAQVAGFNATVVKVDGNRLVVRARQPDGQQGERAVPVDEKTVVKGPQGAPARLADLQPEARVYITPETGTATRVRLLPQRGPDALGQPRQPAGPAFGQRTTGKLLKVDGKTIVVRPGFGEGGAPVVVRRGADPADDPAAEKTFTTDENTRVLVDGDDGKVEDLKPGMQVSVFASRPGQPAGLVSGRSVGLTGTVVRVDGAAVVLRVAGREQQGKEVTVATDEKTKVMYLAGMARTPKSPTVADLEPGMLVSVLPVTGVAEKITVIIKRPPPQQP